MFDICRVSEDCTALLCLMTVVVELSSVTPRPRNFKKPGLLFTTRVRVVIDCLKFSSVKL